MFKTINYLSLAVLMLGMACGTYDAAELYNIPEYVELTKTIEKIGTFKDFDLNETWRLLIDGRKAAQGPMVFDREEKGYLAGLAQGLDFALKNRERPLTIELLEQIRNETTKNILVKEDDKTTTTTSDGTPTSSSDKTNPYNFKPGHFVYGMGGNGVRFNMSLSSNATEEGMQALRDKIEAQFFNGLVSIKYDDGKPYLHRQYASRAEVTVVAQKILDTYEASGKTLRDIVILAQNLDQLHPFNDGNIRTFALITVQKELARTKETPVILYNPNRFDVYTVDQLLDIEIAEGQKEFLRYKKH